MELLENFASTLTSRQKTVFKDVNKYLLRETKNGAEDFKPEGWDDAEIRTYLLECSIQGASQPTLKRIRASLEKFYTWLKTNDLIAENPFEKFHLNLPALSMNPFRMRHEAFQGQSGEKEITRLRALNLLAEVTNRTSDVQSMLEATLETLLGVMTLNTAWVSLKSDSGFLHQKTKNPPEHGFMLAAVHNLPPSLEQSDRIYMKRAPACNCQKLLNLGRLKRGVNVVECSRLQDASKTNQENNGLMFHASVPIIINEQAIGVMNFATQEWQLLSASDLQFLTAGARQVGAALERARLYDQVQSQHARLKHEMNMARKVQASLMPDKLPKIRGYDLAALWKPANDTSGDYYNVFKLPGGRWGFMVADVCDKGAPAALYMALAHGLIRERVANESSPAALLLQVNRALCDLDIKSNFITSFYAILDPASSTLKYAVAGHPQPLLRKASGKVNSLPGKGMVLGVSKEAVYKDMNLSLTPGDTVVAFTDGMTDANNPASEHYELGKLKKAVGSAPVAARAMLKHL